MESYLRFAFWALFVCTMAPCLVLGDCDIKTPPRCDLMYPEVVKNVSFNGTCTHENVAHVAIGSTYELNFTFTPVADAHYASCHVVVELPLGIEIPVVLANPNACDGMGLTCPLKAHTKYTAHNVFYLQKFPVYTDLFATIRWALVNEPLNSANDDFEEIFCIRVAAMVQPEPTPSPPAVEEEEEPSFRVVH